MKKRLALAVGALSEVLEHKLNTLRGINHTTFDLRIIRDSLANLLFVSALGV